MLDAIARDVIHATRSLRRTKGHSAVAILTLALGIGATTALFSVVNGTLLKPLPFANGERLVAVRHLIGGAGVHSHEADDGRWSPLELADLRAQPGSFDALVEYHSMSFNMLGRGEPQRVQTGVVSAAFFDALGVRPLLGRTFRSGEDQPGANPVVVLGYEYWRDRLGGDPSIVGQTVEMTDRVHTVVGVLPPLPQFPETNDVFMPVSSCPFRSSPFVTGDRTARMVRLFGVLAPGREAAAAHAEVATVQRRAAAAYPDAYPPSQRFAATLVPVREELTGQARPTLLLLLATAALVLAVACANVASLVLVKLVRSRHELALRAALGAGRARIARQVFTEGLLLALAGAAAGIGVAFAGQRLLVAFAARFTPRATEIGVDARVLGFALAAAVGTALVASLAPLAAIGRDLETGLRSRSDPTMLGTRRLERGFVVAQLALSAVLLVAAGLALRGLLAVKRVDPGFSPERVLTTRVTPSRDKYTSPVLVRGANERLLAAVQAVPGVRQAALASTYPMNEGEGFSQPVVVDGRAPLPEGTEPQTEVRIVSDDYFRTIGIPLRTGRAFSAADRGDSAAPVAVINRTLARTLWKERDPAAALGARLSLNGGRRWLTVVGVVGDVRQYGLDRAPVAELYVAMSQRPILGLAVLVSTSGDPLALTSAVREAVRSVDPQIPVDQVRTLDQARDDSLAARRLTATLLLLFGAVALAIAAAGVGGVLAFSVSRRRHEFGVRMALGARRAQVLRLVLRQAGTIVGAGLALGLGAAVLLAGVMTRFVYGISATDPVTFALVVAALGLAGMLAALGPARQATRVAPMEALRGE
ncbi:MAG: ABC transporter permease [Gemmatimonadaceae bacterium]